MIYRPIALVIALVLAPPVLAQDAALPEWRAADDYAAAAANVDPALAMPLINGDPEATDKAWACASCHGDAGQGAETIPRLSGLSVGYIVKQLHDYKTGVRQNNNMQYVARTLTDEQMAALGAYYGALDAPPAATPSLGGDLERGRMLALEGDWNVDLPSCFTCHGPSGWGVGQAFPAIAGQNPSYIHAQLAAWKAGSRANAPLGLMQSVAAALSDDDMRAVSDYLASLPPPQRLPASR